MRDEELVRLEADARYARERFQLYRARIQGPRPTSPARLRELKLTCQRAEARLRRAKTIPGNN